MSKATHKLPQQISYHEKRLVILIHSQRQLQKYAFNLAYMQQLLAVYQHTKCNRKDQKHSELWPKREIVFMQAELITTDDLAGILSRSSVDLHLYRSNEQLAFISVA
jgi:hypothetical protein